MELFNEIRPKYIEQLVTTHKSNNYINFQNYSGNTPLHKMVATKRIKSVEKLLELGADPNIKNDIGNTPLHIIMSRNQCTDRELVEILIKYNANSFLPNYKKEIPFNNQMIRNIVMIHKFKVHKHLRKSKDS